MPEIQSKSFTEARFVYKPPYVGSAKLVAKFTSKEMDDVDGFRVFEISPKPDEILMPEANNDVISRSDVHE